MYFPVKIKHTISSDKSSQKSEENDAGSKVINSPSDSSEKSFLSSSESISVNDNDQKTIMNDKGYINVECPDLDTSFDLEEHESKTSWPKLTLQLNNRLSQLAFDNYIIPEPKGLDYYRERDHEENSANWTLIKLKKPKQTSPCSTLLPVMTMMNAVTALVFDCYITLISLRLTAGEGNEDLGMGLGICSAAFNVFTTLLLFYLAGALNIPAKMGESIDNCILRRRPLINTRSTNSNQLYTTPQVNQTTITVAINDKPSWKKTLIKYTTACLIVSYNVIKGIVMYQEVSSLGERLSNKKLINTNSIFGLAFGASTTQTTNNTLFQLSFVKKLMEKIEEYYQSKLERQPERRPML